MGDGFQKVRFGSRGIKGEKRETYGPKTYLRVGVLEFEKQRGSAYFGIWNFRKCLNLEEHFGDTYKCNGKDHHREVGKKRNTQ